MAPTVDVDAEHKDMDASFWQDPYIEDSSDIRCLILVVHGMGRQLEERGKYRTNIFDMRSTIQSVLHEELDCGDTATVAVLPIEWHSHLHAQVDERMASATLSHCSMMRVLCNEYMGDVLYYFTEEHGRLVREVVTAQLNEQYAGFCQKHPQFNGPVWVVGFSLGGVCCYDVLAQQRANQETPQPQHPALTFQPSRLFTFGSPVGAVMVMRGWEMQRWPLPTWCRHHNVFHPCDPMGYRLEPLIQKNYKDIPPVTVDHLPPRLSRRDKLLSWMASPYSGALLPGMSYAMRFLSSMAGYMAGTGSTTTTTTTTVTTEQTETTAKRPAKRRRCSSSSSDGDSSHRWQYASRDNDNNYDSASCQVSEADWWSESITLTVETNTVSGQSASTAISVSDDGQDGGDQDTGAAMDDAAEYDEQQAAANVVAVDEQEVDDEEEDDDEDDDDDDYVQLTPDTCYATEDTSPLDQRIDFVLHEPRLHSLNEYVIGLHAHFGYWRNRDLMRHLLRHLDDLPTRSVNTPPTTPVE